MQLEFALFCDSAEIDAMGLMYLLRGGYDLVTATAFPAALNRMALVVRLWCEPAEIDREHVLVAQIIDPNAHVLPIPMQLPFTPPPYPGNRDRRNRMTLKLEYTQIQFPEPGDYSFRFLVDGVQVGAASLEVRRKEGTGS
jgi:hypothetical protein